MFTQVEIVEVGPRDGFQNIERYIPAETKLNIISEILNAGVRHMQITSFVSPKAVPQMRDAKEIVSAVLEKYDASKLDLFALVPNLRGAQSAFECGLKKVTNVISLSKSHNMANIRRTHDQSFEELNKILDSFPDLDVTVDIATTFGCPFEGKYRDPEPLLHFVERAYSMGIREFTLCDTVGLADPAQVRSIIKNLRSSFTGLTLGIHIHDTRGMGLVNTLAAIEAGIDSTQSTLGGLGGCPFAPGASGNTATEDLVNMLIQMGYETMIRTEDLLEASRHQREWIPEGIYSGHLLNIQHQQQCKM